MITRDNLHFSFREIDGYNRLWNIVFCEREAGKTTSIENDKILADFLKRGVRTAYLVRKSVEITEDLIHSIETRINRFLPDDEPISFTFSKKEFKDGVVSLFLTKNKKKDLVCKIISLGIDLQRLKKIAIKDIHAILFDEYVVNPKYNEKYVKGEFFKIQELYTTLKRFEYKPKGLKIYLCGNPYSKYTPAIVGLGVDTNKMRQGARIVGDNYIVECYKIKEELKAKILAENPMYEFDETYKKYAFDGEYINDKNINVINETPANYSLRYVFNIQGKYIGIFKNNAFYKDHNKEKFYVKPIKFDEVRKVSFCFDIDDLVNGSVLCSNEERFILSTFKKAIRERDIAFYNVECYYMVSEVYKNL